MTTYGLSTDTTYTNVQEGGGNGQSLTDAQLADRLADLRDQAFAGI